MINYRCDFSGHTAAAWSGCCERWPQQGIQKARNISWLQHEMRSGSVIKNVHF
ncbi:MAG: hypothetical protein ACJARF_000112 [Alteromonadaceae bacterium]|jgi:hypothetical protein